MAIIDLDEFIVPAKSYDIITLLKDYEQYPAIAVNWIQFDGNNHIKKPEGLVIENYKRAFLPELAIKYRDYFKEKYTPKLEMSSYIYMKEFEKYDIKVGVHIRKGDYKYWNNGKYYYEDKVYNDKIEQFSNLFKGKKILFILFSNEEITLKPKQNYIISKCDWYEDHYLLSLCDYIIGAPSTFTIWASFIGNVPLMHILSRDDKVDLNSFNVNVDMTPI